MNERPTPNTDQEESRMRDGGCPYIVTADFARRLERQRNELVEAMDALLEHKPRPDWGGLTIAERLAWDNAKDAIAAVKEGARP